MINNKILFIVNVDWFFISHRLPIALEALKKGYDVSIACGITDKKEYIENLGIKVYPLNLSRGGTGIFFELKTFFEIYMNIKKINPDICHFISIKPIIYGGIASKILNLKKRVFSISGLGFIFINQGLKANITRFIVKKMYKIALSGKNSYVIIQNPDDEKIVKSLSDVKTKLIKGSGISLDEYKYIKETNENIKVVMACRLLRDKGVFEYINAVRKLNPKFNNINFELYGDIDVHNPASLTSKDLIKLKDENIVTLHGFSNKISEIFSKSNIVVLPSYREGLPKVLIEAAACGRAVITTDVPGCRDSIKPNITGKLCKVRDSDSLAKEIEELILNNDLRNSFGEKARKLAEEDYDIKKVVRKHFDIYEGN